MIRIATLVAPALLAGCVSVQQIPLTATTGGALRDREVSLAVRDKPDFAAMTPGKAAIGGLIGAALMIEAGNQIIKEHSVEDPASQIAEAVRAGLNESYRARSSSKTVRIASDDVAQTSRDNAALDLLLDVRTINWSFVYFPTSWNRYRVIYTARTRLIDVKRAQVVAEGGCKHIPEDSSNAPSYEEFLANGAERLKKELQTAAAACVEQLWTATLALSGKAPQLAAAPSPVAAAAPVASAASPTQTAGTTRTPLPTTIEVVSPAAGTAGAAFSGSWIGKWDGQVDHTLIVEKIEGRKAMFIYSWSAAEDGRGPSKPGFQRVVGTIDDDGALRGTLNNGANVMYRLSGDQLSAEWQNRRRYTRATLVRGP